MCDRVQRADWPLLVYPEIPGAASERLELVASYQWGWWKLPPQFLTLRTHDRRIESGRSFTPWAQYFFPLLPFLHSAYLA